MFSFGGLKMTYRDSRCAVSIPVVDWSGFAQWPRPTLTCRCGNVYISHCKHVWHEGAFTPVTEGPCPRCGAQMGNVVRAEHPPERWEIGGRGR